MTRRSEILKSNGIRRCRIVLDLGGTAGDPDNPLAAIDAIEKSEDLDDARILVLTGNKNPKTIEEVEARGYKCLMKSQALDLVDRSDELPKALSTLTGTDLRRNIHIHELFIRVERVEDQIDAIFLTPSSTAVRDLARDVQFIEARILGFESNNNRLSELTVRQESSTEDLRNIQLKIEKIEQECAQILESQSKITSAISGGLWLFAANRKSQEVLKFIAFEGRKWAIDNVKLIVIINVTALLVSSPLWVSTLDKIPAWTNKVRGAIEHLLKPD
ncbi:MAG: hypothetical protein HC942_23320 [Microcoleus sp. SU_5_6]|nr:hypothetical protein [Microcoleus sp. SU_5_6]